MNKFISLFAINVGLFRSYIILNLYHKDLVENDFYPHL